MADASYGAPYRKRKPSGLMSNTSDDEEGGDRKSARFETKEQSKERFARENHSEIERRRRNKMNAYINELSDMVPSCNGLIRKPDKLTILKMAVSYMKSLRGSPPPADSNYKPSFLSDQELKHLVLEAADGFLFVITCKTSTVIYVSDSITPVLNQAQVDWINQSFFDLIHPEDVDKIKDQLATEVSTDTRILDLKTGNVRKDGPNAANRLSAGSRRNFVVRMRCGTYEGDYEETDARLIEIRNRCKEKRICYKDDSYAVVHCTGYIRNLGQLAETTEEPVEDGSPTLSCLVAIGRLQPTSMPTSKDLIEAAPATEFITRQTLNGRFSFVDQRVTDILGYRPVDLLGKSCYDFYIPEDVEYMSENYEQVLKLKGQPLSIRYHFKHANGEPVLLRSSCYSFQNPYTDEAEYIVCTNNIVKNKPERTYTNSASSEPFDGCKPSPRASADEQVSPKPTEVDVTSVIQERPGMFPYPYQLQPASCKDTPSILESELRGRNKIKPCQPRPVSGKEFLPQDYSEAMSDESVYRGASQASGILANMARKHQQEGTGMHVTPPSAPTKWTGVSPPYSFETTNTTSMGVRDSNPRAFEPPQDLVSSMASQMKAPRNMSGIPNFNQQLQSADYTSRLYMTNTGYMEQENRQSLLYPQQQTPTISQSSPQEGDRRLPTYNSSLPTNEYQYY